MKLKLLLKYLFVFLMTFIFLACEKTFVPKPKGYHRIDLPPHSYQDLENKHPYFFKFSRYAKTSNHKSKSTEEHWIDVTYPEHRAVIQLTYKNLKGKKLDLKNKNFLNELVNDSYKLTSKHNIKAYAIDETIIRTPTGKAATIFELEGDVPSQFQFYITDTTNHFLRGALYFRTSTKNDSLAPIINYIKIDIVQMLNTLEWK
ncbi:MAG: gliding motility lipoprotein GldD [Cytophagales bacterium]|nr:MAG: gliding motility lipoprotein GldD [Cytophagales bacterium]